MKQNSALELQYQHYFHDIFPLFWVTFILFPLKNKQTKKALQYCCVSALRKFNPSIWLERRQRCSTSEAAAGSLTEPVYGECVCLRFKASCSKTSCLYVWKGRGIKAAPSKTWKTLLSFWTPETISFLAPDRTQRFHFTVGCTSVRTFTDEHSLSMMFVNNLCRTADPNRARLCFGKP